MVRNRISEEGSTKIESRHAKTKKANPFNFFEFFTSLFTEFVAPTLIEFYSFVAQIWLLASLRPLSDSLIKNNKVDAILLLYVITLSYFIGYIATKKAKDASINYIDRNGRKRNYSILYYMAHSYMIIAIITGFVLNVFLGYRAVGLPYDFFGLNEAFSNVFVVLTKLAIAGSIFIFVAGHIDLYAYRTSKKYVFIIWLIEICIIGLVLKTTISFFGVDKLSLFLNGALTFVAQPLSQYLIGIPIFISLRILLKAMHSEEKIS